MLRYLHPLSARRCLITVIAAMALATVAGNILLDRCPMSARFSEADITLKSWRTHASTPEIVFFGSSRTGYSTGAEVIEPRVQQISGDASVQVFSAAVPAGEPITMNFMGEQLFAGARIPKIAVIEITPDSVARRNRFLDFVVTRQFTFGDIVHHFGDICHSTGKTVSRVLSSRLIPFYTHRLSLRHWAMEAWLSPGKPYDFADPKNEYFQGFWGRSGLPKSLPGMPPDLRAAGDAARVRTQLADYEISGGPPAALEALIARCHGNGVKVILLETPMHSKLRAVFVPSVDQQYRVFLKHLEHNYDCRFVDFSDRLPDAMFFDDVHTNGEGREYFSELFADEVLGPAWRAETRSRHE